MPQRFPGAFALLAFAAPLCAQTGLDWGGYLGGSGREGGPTGHLIATAENGDVFIAGMTSSADFPASVTFGPTGGEDAFIARFGLNGQRIWSARIGGSANDFTRGVFFDRASQRLFVGGHAESSDFPTTATAHQATNRGQIDAWLAIFDTSGALPSLSYSSYFGGAGRDTLPGIHAEPGSQVVTLGLSTNGSDLPVTPGAFDANPNGDWDIAIVRLDTAVPGAAAVRYASYIGSDGAEFLRRMHVDDSGVITVQGRCGNPSPSAGHPFPTVRAWQPTYGGGIHDHVVFRFDPSLAGAGQLVWSTYFGGAGDDNAFGLSVSRSGIVTIAGMTSSPNLPMSSPQPTLGGSYDMFVARFDPGAAPGAQFLWGTYLGSTAFDGAGDVLCDEAGVVTLAGYSRSPACPTTAGAFSRQHGGSTQNGYFARIDSRSGRIEYASFLGSRSVIYGVAPDTLGGVFAVAEATSSSLPVTNGSNHAGGMDVWVGRFSLLPGGVAAVGSPSTPCSARTYATVDSQPVAGRSDFGLLARDVPIVGSNVTSGVLAIDLTAQVAPTSFLGIDLHVRPLVGIALGGATGPEVRVPVALAAVPPGASLAVQFLWLNPATCVAPLSASQAIQITVQ